MRFASSSSSPAKWRNEHQTGVLRERTIWPVSFGSSPLANRLCRLSEGGITRPDRSRELVPRASRKDVKFTWGESCTSASTWDCDHAASVVKEAEGEHDDPAAST